MELLQGRTFRDQIRTRCVFHVKHDHVGTGKQYSSPTQCPGTRSHGDPPGLDLIFLGLPVGVLALDAVGFRQCRSGTKGFRYGLTQVLVGARSARGRRLPVVFHKRRDQTHEPRGTSHQLTGPRVAPVIDLTRETLMIRQVGPRHARSRGRTRGARHVTNPTTETDRWEPVPPRLTTGTGRGRRSSSLSQPVHTGSLHSLQARL